MNSRYELRNAMKEIPKMKPVVDSAVKRWENDGDIEYIDYCEKDRIEYWDGEFMRTLYYPETDTQDRIKDSIICDPEAEQFINPEACAAFIYNCIDVNAVSSVKNIAFIYDDADDSRISPAREELYERAGDGCDEYAYEVGLDMLGITWVERSTIIINVREIAEACMKEARLNADVYGSPVEAEFAHEFKTCLTSTLCHEFRHAVYELNDFAPATGLNNEGPYPASGREEAVVEEYGGQQAADLMRDAESSRYINKMLNRDRMRAYCERKAASPETGHDIDEEYEL